jgi:hypothetical protein
MRHVNLADLEAAAHTVSLTADGQRHRVRPVTGRILNMVAAAEQAEGLAKMQAYYDIAALLVPTMRRDDVDNLSADQVALIMTLARGEVDTVDEAAADPNGPRPATKAAPGRKGSRPPVTPSAASS